MIKNNPFIEKKKINLIIAFLILILIIGSVIAYNKLNNKIDNLPEEINNYQKGYSQGVLDSNINFNNFLLNNLNKVISIPNGNGSINIGLVVQNEK